MTNQEAFNIVVQHLRTQGQASRDHNGECVYRHSDGIKRCAVGILIPDDEYSSTFEGYRIEDLRRARPYLLEGVDLHLLQAMQDAHDIAYIPLLICGIQLSELCKGARSSVEGWRTWMEACYTHIAQRFELTVPDHPCKDQHDQEGLHSDSQCYQEA